MKGFEETRITQVKLKIDLRKNVIIKIESNSDFFVCTVCDRPRLPLIVLTS